MDEKNGDCCKFQGILLSIVKSKLNLMLMEISQLYQEGLEVDFENNQVLIKTILKKIADKKIKSAHITPEEAVGFINIFDEMGSHTEKSRLDFVNWKDDDLESGSTYSDSPFK